MHATTTMAAIRVRCIADSTCPNKYANNRGCWCTPDNSIKCANEECTKRACCNNAVCLNALFRHHTEAHLTSPFKGLSHTQLHSLAHNLTHYFALDKGLVVARKNHAAVNALEDHMGDNSDLFNKPCCVCKGILGAFCFQREDPDMLQLVCYGCAIQENPSITITAEDGAIRLWDQ